MRRASSIGVAIDGELISADKFWHVKGREGEGVIVVSREEAEEALDAAFLAATSIQDNDESFQAWADVDAEERLEQHLAWMKARRELLEEGLTQSQLAAIAGYVALKEKSSVTAALVQERADHEETRGLGRSRLKTAAVFLGLTAIFGGLGWTQAPSLANGELPPQTSSVSVQQEGARAGGLNGFKVGSKTIYTKAVKGKCDAGEMKLKMPKTQKVNWEWQNGNVGKKTVKKGVTVCKFVSKSGVTSEATYNAAGVMTKLPANFPKNPTVKDIESLGLSFDSKVAPQLRVPMPKTPIAPGVLAQTVKPVDIWKIQIPKSTGWTSEGGETFDGMQDIVMVKWELKGGSGVVMGAGTPSLGYPAHVAFDSEGNATLVSSVGGLGEGRDGLSSKTLNSHGIFPNYGQGSVPASMTQDWDLDSMKVKDASGIGDPVGVNANPSVIKGGIRDGTILFRDSDLSFIRN
jgi:hypothetical protein